MSDTPRGDDVITSGPGGFLHQQEGQPGWVWTRYSGGDVPVPGVSSQNWVDGHGTGSDVVALPSGNTVQLRDMDSGTTTTITLPSGETYAGTFGSRLLTYTFTADRRAIAAQHVLTLSGGQLTDTLITGWPAGAQFDGRATAGDDTSALIPYRVATGFGLALLDLSTAQVTSVFQPVTDTNSANMVLTSKYVGWFAATPGGPTTLHLRDRSNLSAPETTVQIPVPTLPSGAQATVAKVAIVGNSLLVGYSAPVPGNAQPTASQVPGLYQMPLAGGPLTLAVDHAYGFSLVQTPDGALVTGGTSATDWATLHFTADSTGAPISASVYPEPQVVNAVSSIALAGGHLVTVQSFDESRFIAYTRTVTWGGSAPTYGDVTTIGDSPSNMTITALPDGSYGQVWQAGGVDGDSVSVQGATSYGFRAHTTGGTLTDANSTAALYSTANGQYIGLNHGPNGTIDYTSSTPSAALMGGYLWTPGATPGSLTMTDLRSQETRQSVETGANCTPTDLQTAASRWIYWSCGTNGPAGVWDLSTGTDITVPTGQAQLADGYLVTHDTSAGKLELTDFHTGTPATTDLADLPAGTVTDDRRVTWAVDKFGGGIAYVDAQNNIHLLDPHIPASQAQPDPGLALLPGQELTAGHSLTSASVKLVMQADGNLVAYLMRAPQTPGPAIWSANTSGHPGAHAVMQPDGNLVVYGTDGKALWASNTPGHPGAHAVLQDDGNLVVYLPTGAVAWAAGTNAGSATLTPGTVLRPGWWTQDGLVRLVMQPDGNLVMYRERDGSPIWSTNTSGHPGAHATMQSDGNLVLYATNGKALWASNTSGHPGAYAVLQPDGNFVIYQHTTALWATGTYRTAH